MRRVVPFFRKYCGKIRNGMSKGNVKNKLFLVLLATFLWGNFSFGQEKYEREYRIKEREVPAAAREFVSAFSFDKKIKWYAEEGLNTRSVEAKTKFQGKRYSIEFDTLGNVQDVEVEIAPDELPVQTRGAIDTVLKREFKDLKFIKIQVQYTGDRDSLIAFHQGRLSDGRVTTKYEIILKGENESGVSWYEYRFAADGSIESRAVVVFRNTDNLEY